MIDKENVLNKELDLARIIKGAVSDKLDMYADKRISELKEQFQRDLEEQKRIFLIETAQEIKLAVLKDPKNLKHEIIIKI